MKITQEIIQNIITLSESHSISEIAVAVGCCKGTVLRILRKNKIIRSRENIAMIRSRVRNNMVRNERRRAIFGLDQKSCLKVFTNKERNKLKYCLRRKGYLFLERGATVAYYNCDTNRDLNYEERGRKLGLRFMDQHFITTKIL